MKNYIVAILLFSCSFIFINTYSQGSKNCQQYLIEQTRLVQSLNLVYAKIYLDEYKVCLWHERDSLSQEKARNLSLFNLVSMAEGGRGGWGRKKTTNDEYLVDQNFKIIRPLVGLHYAYEAGYSIFIISEGDTNRFGVIDSRGNVLIKPVYEKIYDIQEGKFAVQNNGKWGFVDTKGKIVVPIVYDEVRPFQEGLAAVQQNKKWGFINAFNKPVISLSYELANSFCNGLAAIKSSGKFGFIDKAGKMKIPFEYEDVREFVNKLVCVKKNARWALIDINGKPLTDFKFDGFLKPLGTYDFIYTYFNGKMGCTNTKGEIVVEAIYDQVVVMDKQRLSLYRNDTAILYNFKTKDFSARGYRFVSQFFYNGIARIQDRNKFGFIDTAFKEIIPLEYDFVSEVFLDGLARVKKTGKVGYINKRNEVMIPLEYDDEISNTDGVLLLRKNSTYHLYTTDGNFIRVFPNNYIVNGEFFNGLARFRIGLKQGYVNQKGEVAIEAKYDYLPEHHTGKIRTSINNVWGCIDLKGNAVVPFIYENEENLKLHVKD